MIGTKLPALAAAGGASARDTPSGIEADAAMSRARIGIRVPFRRRPASPGHRHPSPTASASHAEGNRRIFAARRSGDAQAKGWRTTGQGRVKLVGRSWANRASALLPGGAGPLPEGAVPGPGAGQPLLVVATAQDRGLGGRVVDQRVGVPRRWAYGMPDPRAIIPEVTWMVTVAVLVAAGSLLTSMLRYSPSSCLPWPG